MKPFKMLDQKRRSEVVPGTKLRVSLPIVPRDYLPECHASRRKPRLPEEGVGYDLTGEETMCFNCADKFSCVISLGPRGVRKAMRIDEEVRLVFRGRMTFRASFLRMKERTRQAKLAWRNAERAKPKKHLIKRAIQEAEQALSALRTLLT